MRDNSASRVPLPPAFHWALVLILDLVTLGIFGYVWAIVQAVWAREVHPSNRALRLYIFAIVLSLAGAVLEGVNASVQLQALAEIAGALVATFGAFSVKNTLEAYMRSVQETPVYLSGLMTIFFGEVYLQYHMNRVRSFESHGTLANAL